MINQSLELAIRKGYSGIYPKLRALELWVISFLSELCFQDEVIHEFKVRIKSPESLLNKAEKLIINNESIKDFDDILDKVTDIVGARINVYLLSKLVVLHGDIIRLSEDKFIIKSIILHYLENEYTSIRNEFKLVSQNSGIQIKEISNNSGYFGVHYIISPLKSSFVNSKVDKYERFELQIRTLIQDTWSELERNLFYKTDSQLSRIRDKKSFFLNTNFVRTFDMNLELVVQSTNKYTPTYEISEEVGRESILPKFQNIHNEIYKLLLENEKENISASAFLMRAEDIFQMKEVTEIKESKLEHNFKRSLRLTYSKLVLAYLYLKTGHTNLAYEIYIVCKKFAKENILFLSGNDVAIVSLTLYLRLAETCYRLENKEDETKENLQEFKKIYLTKTADILSDSHILFTGASLLSWRLNLFDSAIYFGHIANNFLDKEIKAMEPQDNSYTYLLLRSLMAKTNLLYYYLDKWLVVMNQNPEHFAEISSSLVDLYNDIMSILDTNYIKFDNDDVTQVSRKCDLYDTIAWYCYCSSLNLFNSISSTSRKSRIPKINQSLELIEQASEYISNCFFFWNEYSRNERAEPKEMWKDHYVMVMDLKAKIKDYDKKLIES